MSDFQRRLQLQLPSPTQLFTPAVTVFLVLSIIGFAVATYAPTFTANWLGLSGRGVFRGKVWQLVTYPFFASRVFPFIWSCVILLFMGSAVERQWKTRGFVVLWLVVSITCGVMWVLISVVLYMIFSLDLPPALGNWGCIYGIIAVFGILYKKQKFLVYFFVMEGQHLAILMIAIGLVASIASPFSLVFVAGALIAYFYTKLRQASAEIRSSRRSESSEMRAGGFVDVD
jgi:membrane associated rhomboid family serine protease